MTDSERKSFNVAFGNFIKNGRLDKGILQGEVSRHLGVSQAYYCYLEAGERSVDLQMANRICRYLQLDLNKFLKKQK